MKIDFLEFFLGLFFLSEGLFFGRTRYKNVLKMFQNDFRTYLEDKIDNFYEVHHAPTHPHICANWPISDDYTKPYET